MWDFETFIDTGWSIGSIEEFNKFSEDDRKIIELEYDRYCLQQKVVMIAQENWRPSARARIDAAYKEDTILYKSLSMIKKLTFRLAVIIFSFFANIYNAVSSIQIRKRKPIINLAINYKKQSDRKGRYLAQVDVLSTVDLINIFSGKEIVEKLTK